MNAEQDRLRTRVDRGPLQPTIAAAQDFPVLADGVGDPILANVERGLMWAQEPLVSRGVQANYTMGPFSASVSWNDGYYSNNYNWISGLASYALNKENTIAVAASAANLLLLGDPQQLPQVSQGTHPEPVNGSALGWLVGMVMGIDHRSAEARTK